MSASPRAWTRGAIWIGVGGALWIGSLLLDYPIVIRGTGIPAGAGVMVLGLGVLIWDLVRATRSPPPP
jgi:hypothetical protein